MKTKLSLITLVFIGLLAACASQPTETPLPASQPTEEVATATEEPIPTDTAVPPTVTPTEEPTAISFSSDIAPLLQSRCQNCHGGDRGTEEGLDLTSYENLMAGSDNGPVVIAGDADASLIVEMLVEKKMPKKGPKLAPPQVQLIIDWVNQGALDN